jgi:hypothetical protein
MERYLYPTDGISQGITTGKYISSITIARKQHGLTRGTGKETSPCGAPRQIPKFLRCFFCGWRKIRPQQCEKCV